MLEQALAQEICHLDTADLFQDGVHLVRPVKASKKIVQTLSSLIGEELKEAMSSQCARINHVECHKDDVVVYQTAGNLRVAEIQLHFLLHGALTTLVKAWQVKEWVPHQQFATCTVLDQNLGFVPTADILVPLICHKSQEEASALALSDLQQILAGWKKTTGAYSHGCMHVCFSFDSPLALHCLHIWIYNHNSLCGISPARGITYQCVAFHCFFLAFEGHCIVQFLSFFHTAEDMKACTNNLETTWLPCFSQ